MSDMFTDTSQLSCSLEKLNDFYSKDKKREIVTQISNRNCRTCNKATVCKYSKKVVEEVEKLINEITKMELPLNVSINCKEWGELKILR